MVRLLLGADCSICARFARVDRVFLLDTMDSCCLHSRRGAGSVLTNDLLECQAALANLVVLAVFWSFLTQVILEPVYAVVLVIPNLDENRVTCITVGATLVRDDCCSSFR